MSKLDEIYDEGLKDISCVMDEYVEVKNSELAFSEISKIVEQARIKAGNHYMNTCKMYQTSEKEN